MTNFLEDTATKEIFNKIKEKIKGKIAEKKYTEDTTKSPDEIKNKEIITVFKNNKEDNNTKTSHNNLSELKATSLETNYNKTFASDFTASFKENEVSKLFLVILLFSIFYYLIYKIIKKIFYSKNKEILKSQFKTPKDHRALTIGYLIDGKLHKRDLAGSIVQLYQDNYIDISYDHISKNKFYEILEKFLPFLSHKSWIIKRTPKNTYDLDNSEIKVLKYLFPENYSEKSHRNNTASNIISQDNPLSEEGPFDHNGNVKNFIKLSEIKNRPQNNIIFKEIENEVIKEIEDFKYKNNTKGEEVIRKIVKVTTFLSMLTISVLLFFSLTNLKTFNHITLFLIFILIIFVITYFFFKKIEKITGNTKKGSRIKNSIDGYKLYLKTVFKDRTNFFDILEKDREKLSQDLPYMISFDINNRFKRLINSLEYDSEDKKDRKNFLKKVIFWPIFIIISIVFLYFYYKKSQLF